MTWKTRRLGIFGATGSIGRQSLEVAEAYGLDVAVLSAGRNVRLLAEQIAAFKPEAVSVADEASAKRLKEELEKQKLALPAIDHGESGMEALAQHDFETAILATSGFAGLPALLACIAGDKRIGLANKESLVAAAPVVKEALKASKAELIPVDSEHSAIWQALKAGRREDLARIYLTASGGPFLHRDRASMQQATAAEALKHPLWSMGAKISVDSASMMNKGLEWIEAMHLFDCPAEAIEILIHPEGLIHSMVEFRDGQVIAQMGPADMRRPIQTAITWPERLQSPWDALDMTGGGAGRSMQFLPPDLEQFPALRWARMAAELGGLAPTVLNAANEIAVHAFLQGQILFGQMPELWEVAMERFLPSADLTVLSLDAIIECDAKLRLFLKKHLASMA